MIRIHREGRKSLFYFLVGLTALNVLAAYFSPWNWLETVILVLSVALYVIILQFFRNPPRFTHAEPGQLIAPADGKVVVIEEVEADEYFKDRRLQVSIFMSPFNVHVNRYPIDGQVVYAKYHPGKYLVAWHPKSSTENERTGVVVESPTYGPVLYKQIAGALAKRIVMYAKEGMKVKVGTDSGFIKFGSRVDLLLPLDASIDVRLGQKVRGGETVIARLQERSKA